MSASVPYVVLVGQDPIALTAAVRPRGFLLHARAVPGDDRRSADAPPGPDPPADPQAPRRTRGNRPRIGGQQRGRREGDHDEGSGWLGWRPWRCWLAGSAPALRAATPADTLVIAKNIDDIISLDPAEVFELSGGEIDHQLYDRVMAYEAEDISKLVPGVAESYSGQRRRQDDHAQDAARPQVPLRQSGDAPRTSPSRCSG